MPKKENTFEEALAGAQKMSERYVAKGPYKFYPDSTVVDLVQRGLAENEVKYGYRYCP
ncbi:MAG: hypothetical protein HY684_04195 [Chloroflexi bacterium]|nr:hypothetical protein [Chloroflexota bacterium]